MATTSRKLDSLRQRPPKTNIYTGTSTTIPDRLVFESLLTISDGLYSQASMGIPATLALGLTECCARLGQGKVFYYARPYMNVSDQVNSLPMLIYMPYVWEVRNGRHIERESWFRKPHVDRLSDLSARSGKINPEALVMPLTCSPYSYRHAKPGHEYTTIKFPSGGLPKVVIYYENAQLYLGWYDQMSTDNNVQHLRVTPHAAKQGYAMKEYFQGDRTALEVYRMFSGKQAVERLRDMVQEFRSDALWKYHALIQVTIRAYKEWAAEGGFEPELKPIDDSSGDSDENDGGDGGNAVGSTNQSGLSVRARATNRQISIRGRAGRASGGLNNRQPSGLLTRGTGGTRGTRGTGGTRGGGRRGTGAAA